jgi:hypothetical protein
MPEFADVRIEDQERTAIKLVVEPGRPVINPMSSANVEVSLPIKSNQVV